MITGVWIRHQKTRTSSSGSDDSSDDSGAETVTNSISIEVNAVITQDQPESGISLRAPLIDTQHQEIALEVLINGKRIMAILDTGSPVTVISRRVYDDMTHLVEEAGISVSSELRKSKIKLFSCEKEQAVATAGECDVKLEHEEFRCVTPVIVAMGLAHECLIGMNVLVRWPTMKEAIRVLTQNGQHARREVEGLSHDPKIARLHNICLPRIFADDGFKHRHLLKKSHENDKSEATTNKVDDVEERDVPGPTTTGSGEEIENFADVVGEDEFRASYLPENRGAEMAINFISA